MKNIQSWKKGLTILCACMICLASCLFSDSASAEPAEYSPYQEIFGCDGGFVYRDEMLLGNEKELSTDLAKASIVLAYSAYNDAPTSTEDILEDMGYIAQSFNYGERFLSDDLVAFNIGFRSIPNTNKRIICVVVRGTSGADEWISDFMVGTDDDHLGFREATDNVKQTLDVYLDTGDKENILWFTGHSRGAAVANMLAAEYTAAGYKTFGYTFACPRVSKTVTKSQNIYNFNNDNDIITKVPPKLMGYERNGTDYPIYWSTAATQEFENKVDAVIEQSGDLQEPLNKFRLSCIGLLLYGSEDITVSDLLQECGEIPELASVEDLADENSLEDFVDAVDARVEETGEVRQLVREMELQTANMSEEEFNAYLASHSDLNDRIYALIRRRIQKIEDIAMIVENLAGFAEDLFTSTSALDVVIAMVKEGKSIVDEIKRAHHPANYMSHINNLYYGYGGEENGVSETVVIPDNITTIGPRCFADSVLTRITYISGNLEYIGSEAFKGCTALEGITIPETVKGIGSMAFLGCTSIEELTIPNEIETVGDCCLAGMTGLKDLTLPVELLGRGNLFYLSAPSWDTYSTGNVETLHVTPGKTGVMANLSVDLEEEAYYTDKLTYLSRASLETVTLDEGIGNIGDYMFSAFSYNAEFTTDSFEVTIPESVTQIGVEAFFGRRGWKNGTIVVPDTVTKIGARCYAYTDAEEAVLPPQLTEIPDGVLAGNTNLTTVTVPPAITSIGSGAFNGCSSLTGIDIPDTVTTIGEQAFLSCTSIEELTIPNQIETIGEYSLAGMTGLKDLTLPVELLGRVDLFNLTYNQDPYPTDGVETLHVTPGTTGVMGDINGEDYSAYSNNLTYISRASLETVILDEGIRNIGDYVFSAFSYNAAFTADSFEVTIPESVTQIGVEAFYGRRGWKNGIITVPDKVTEIGARCFAYTDAEEAELSSQLGEIPDGLFTGNTSLTTVTMPTTIRSIGSGAFNGCSSLTGIDIPETVTAIGEYAFLSCTSIEELTVPDQIETIGEYSLAGMTGLKDLTLPVDLLGRNDLFVFTYNQDPYPTSGVETLHVTPGTTGVMANLSADLEDEAYYTNKLTYLSRASLETVILDEGIRNIGDYMFSAFSYNAAFTADSFEVTIPESVTQIGVEAFYGRSGWKNGKIIVPDTVTEIGARCFADTDAEEAELSSQLGEIPDGLFTGNTSLTTVTIPTTIRSIGSGAFNGCSSLTEIDIPDTVTAIGEQAFRKCTGIDEIYLPDAVESIGTDAFAETDITIVAMCTSYAAAWAEENGTALWVFHDWDLEPSYTWAEDNSEVTATIVCTRDATHTQGTETVETVEKVIAEPTCEGTGLSRFTATFTNPDYTVQEKDNVVIPALGHDWDEPVYVWDDENQTVTASCVCLNNPEHTGTETVGYTSEVTAQATCETAEEITLTAVFENPLFGTKTKKIPGKDALNHAWGTTEYVWNEGHTQVTATRICGNDPEHVQTETVGAAAEVILETKCETSGKTRYTSEAFTNAAFEIQIEELDIPALGHDITEHEAQAPSCTEIGWEAYEACSRCDYTTYVEIPALNHDWDTPTYSWTEDHSTCTATRVCKRNGDHADIPVTVDTTASDDTATCTAAGQIVYTAVFEAPYDTQTFTENTEALGHNWGEATYTWEDDCSACTAEHTCARCSVVETEEGAVTSEPELAPTCIARGKTKYTAAFNKSGFATQTKQVEDVEINPTAHDLEHIPAVTVTCTAAGNIEYWHCTLCGKCFSNEIDAAGDEIEAESVIVAATGHADPLTHVEAKAESCTKAGNIEYWYCPDCGACFSDEAGATGITQASTVIAAHHTLEHKAAVAATCTTAGNIEYWHCTVCGRYFSDAAGTKEITQAGTVAAAHHTLEHKAAAAATCTTAGNTEYWHCTACGKYYSDAAGTKEITQASTVIAAGHSLTAHAAVEATCETAGNSAYWECTVCHKLFSDAAGQTQISAVPVIAALGHDWGNTVYTWTDDNLKVTAFRACRRDPSHTDSETVNTTVETVEATYEAEGKTTYTARFTKPYFETQTKEIVIPKLEEPPVVLPPAGPYEDTTGKYEVGTDGSATYTGPAGAGASVTIPDTILVNGIETKVTAIAAKAFYKNKKLTSVAIGSNIRVIGANAFASCKKLKKVTGGTGVEIIEASAFASCQKLKTIPAFPKLQSIGASAFKNDKVMTKVTLGVDVAFIGKNAFNGCKKLKTITIQTELLTKNNVKSGAFKGIYSKPTVKCPASKKAEYKKMLKKKGIPSGAKYK